MVVKQKDSPVEDEPEVSPDDQKPAAGTAREPEAGEQPAQAGSSGETGEADEIEKLRQEITVLQQRANESTDRMLRAQAELDNVRKRSARDIENAHKYALDKFIAELLPVIDSIELGINAAGDAGDVASLVEGMDLTLRKFFDVLEKFGVTVIDPQGEKFNPEQHEAVSMQEQEGFESGMVITVMQKGYELNGRLIRPAMVIVSS
ncbi:MAG: nucleotide exchange factor GrpE [Gammaproteobacteria bacterium]|nr:nucleotide exchange factor GrpE [Gammaproteobacteria bacterium]